MSFKELLDFIRPSGEILQLCFNRDAADSAQSFHPKTHILIEPNPQLAKEAELWSKGHPGVEILHAPWEKALASLGAFDAIFVASDPTHLLSASDRAARQAKELFQTIETIFPSLSTLRYSDEDLEGLCQSARNSSPEMLSRFLKELEKNGQITEAQVETCMKAHQLPPIAHGPEQGSFLLSFLLACLEKHMRKNSVFASLLSSSAYEDPRFFDEIATNPTLDVKEIPLKNSTLALLVKKLI